MNIPRATLDAVFGWSNVPTAWATGSNVKTPADWKGKNVGVTDLGSGTDDLTLYLAARYGLATKDYTRIGVGAGDTFIAALQHKQIVCGMTSQPTVAAIEKKGIGYSAVDLATTKGTTHWLGADWPTASVLAQRSWVNGHRKVVQKVVDALVATMHWIRTHSAAQIASKMPSDFVSNSLTTRGDYVSALATDKTQFLPNGIMPKGGPAKVFDVEKKAGKITHSVNLATTYTNKYAIAADKLLGYTAASNYTKLGSKHKK